jgi:mycothiol conjugate amidase Mca
MAASRTLLAVHAHPDDECLSTGGILARYAAAGVRTVLVTCTDGAVGEISDPALATPENLVEVRSHELDDSVRVLHIGRSVRLGYRDSGMAGTADNDDKRSFLQSSFDEALERVVRVVREERPQVIVTYDERGGYGHPDHIRAHQVAVAAFHAAGDGARFPDAGAPFSPSKLYYAVIPRSAMRKFAERLRAAGVEAPFQEVREDEDMPFGVADERVTTFIDVSAYIGAKRASLLAHRTQMGPEQFFVRMPESIFGEVFGRETFQRVEGSGPVPEDDLFAGLATS